MMLRKILYRKFAYLLALPVALLLLFMTTTVTFAGTVNISDQAKVLNTSQVQNAASNLSYPVTIYTTNAFNGTTQAFDQQTASKVTQPNLIVIAIDTVHRHLAIRGGTSVPLQQNQYDDAKNAFINSFNSGGGYTNSTIATLQSLQSSLASAGSGSGAGNGNGGYAPSNAGNGLGWLAFSPLLCLGLLIVLGIAFFAFIRNRARRFTRGPLGPVSPYNQYNQPPYGPYNQGPYYGPGYPGSYNQGGIGPWGAGGLGAAAGGLVGYELGKEAGERDARDDQGYGNVNNDGGNFGNDFGGGASGDFGNGGNDFGGGSGGDFGGSNDFGGGSGGDFGGGGGGDMGSSGNF